MIAPKPKYYECSNCGFLYDLDVELKMELVFPSMNFVNIPYCKKCGEVVEETEVFKRIN